MGLYRYTSNKAADDQTTRVILEGTSSDPQRYVDLGGEIELSDEERQQLSRRHRFNEVDEQTKSATGVELPSETQDSHAESEAKREADAKDPKPAAQTRGGRNQ